MKKVSYFLLQFYVVSWGVHRFNSQSGKKVIWIFTILIQVVEVVLF